MPAQALRSRWFSGPLRDRGAAAVELALVLPLLLLLVFGIIDFSRAYNARITMSEAAAEGARALAVSSPTGANAAATARSAAQVAVRTAIDPSVLTPTVVTFPLLTPCPAPSLTTATTPARATARISAPVRLITPLASSLVGSITVSAVGVRQCSG